MLLTDEGFEPETAGTSANQYNETRQQRFEVVAFNLFGKTKSILYHQNLTIFLFRLL